MSQSHIYDEVLTQEEKNQIINEMTKFIVEKCNVSRREIIHYVAHIVEPEREKKQLKISKNPKVIASSGKSIVFDDQIGYVQYLQEMLENSGDEDTKDRQSIIKIMYGNIWGRKVAMIIGTDETVETTK